MREEVSRVTDLYGEKGYSFAEVTPGLKPNSETLTTDVTLYPLGGIAPFACERFTSAGNDKTRDNVIRRELRVNEQEVLSSVDMKRSFQRLNNLNFFETVEILPVTSKKIKLILPSRSKRNPRVSSASEVGSAPFDQFTAIANVSEGNLFGLGYLVRVRGQLGGRENHRGFDVQESRAV